MEAAIYLSCPFALAPVIARACGRQKSRIRARIEHSFDFMSQSMKGFCRCPRPLAQHAS